MAPLLDVMDHPWFTEQKDKRFSFLPRKCCISGDLIWFKRGWRIRYQDFGGHADRWLCDREYLWRTLKVG